MAAAAAAAAAAATAAAAGAAASLDGLGLPPELAGRLRARGVRGARDLLQYGPGDVSELLDVGHSTAEALLAGAAARAAPGYATAAQLYCAELAAAGSRLRTFLPDLDAALRVGVPAGAVTELVGPAGAGKSQLAACLALSAALPPEIDGLGACVMYIDTEHKLSAPRMREIALARAANALAAAGAAASPEAAAALPGAAVQALDRVLIKRPSGLAELRADLASLDLLVARHSVRLVVLDSAAALLRAELGGGRTQLLERGEFIGRQASALKALAERHRIPVVVTNQVTARPSGPAAHAFQQPQAQAQQQQQNDGGGDGGGQLAAALGTKWAHAVNVRLVLERQGDRRFIKIAKSPMSPNLAFEYAITPAGVQQVGRGPVAPQPGGAAAFAGSALAVPIMNERPAGEHTTAAEFDY